MRIRSLSIIGFGCLKNRHFEFPENRAALVIEDNETGKSTLAAALLSVMCGFPSIRRAGEPMKLSEVYKPWDGGDYAVEAVIEAGDGIWKVERNFTRSTFTIREAATNKDVAVRFNTDLAAHFLGLPRDDFLRVAFVTGKDAHRFDSSSNLRSRLAAVVDGSRDSNGADAALASLADPRYVCDGRNVKVDTAVSRLSSAINEKRRTIARLEASLESAGGKARMLDDARANQESLSERLNELDREYRSARLAEQRERVDELESLKQTAHDLAAETTEIETSLNETRQLAIAGDRDPVDLAAARQVLCNAEEALARASGEAKSAGKASNSAGYVFGGIGGLAALASITLMILGKIEPVASILGVLAGVFVAGAGLVAALRAAGRRSSLSAKLEQAHELEDAARGEAVRMLAVFSVECGPNADACELLARTSDKLARYVAGRARLREIGQQLAKVEQSIIDTAAKVEEGHRFLGGNGGPANEVPPRSADKVEADRRATRLELDQAAESARQLEGEVGAIVHEYRRNYPDLEEQIRELERQLAKASRFQRAVAIAQDALARVSQSSRRRWAVALNEHAADILPRLNPDYDQMLFDDSLSFTLRSKREGRVIEKNEVDVRLSTGAKDQACLAVRFAICRELSRLGESIPVILDDPLISSDDARFVSGMRYLIEELAKEQQVIILSCHQSRHDELLAAPWCSEGVEVIGL